MARTTNWGVRWLVAAVCAAAGWLFLSQVLHLPHRETSPSIPWWVLAVCFAATEVFVVLLRLRRGSQSISLSEIPLILGLAFASPVGVVAARVLGGTVAIVGHRRQRGVKLLFNISHFALEACVAVLAYRWLLGGASPGEPRGWAAAIGVALLLDLLGALTVTAAISMHQGGFDRHMLVESAGEGAVAAVATTSLALVAVLVLETDVRAAGLLFVVAVVLQLSYRAYTGLGHSHTRMELLYGFTSEVGRSVDAISVQSSILVEARRAVGAESAVLVLLDGGGSLHVRLGPDDTLTTTTHPSLAPPGSWWAEALTGSTVVRSRDDRLASRPSGPGQPRDGVAVPFDSDTGVSGVLVVENRLDDVSRFGSDDVRLLETLANHARISIENTTLVDQLREKAAEQEHEATHDHLTGLPNRRWFTAALDEALAGEIGTGRTAVMLLDLDRFKEINDTLGHPVGDDVLREVGRRLAAASGDRAAIARLGGDEYAVAVRHLESPEEAVVEAHRLLHVVERPVTVADLEIDLRASIGVAVAGVHGSSSRVLLQRADVAMYEAKAHHGGVSLYDPVRDQYTPRRLALAAELRRAIEHRELELYYQPKMDVGTRRPMAVEALVRWRHPEHGLVFPDEFIPLAESTGLIRPLTQLVLEEGLRQCAAWRARGLWLGVAVNVSTRSLLDDNFPDLVAQALRDTGTSPHVLTLEITENSIMADPERCLTSVRRLHSSGIRLSVDDFGTGYSSLAYLKQLPVDEVKIDKSFVMTLPTDPSDATIVRSTIELGHHLGLTVVAEGVETEAALAELARGGCDLAQGYLFSRPQAPADLEAWMRSLPGATPDALVAMPARVESGASAPPAR